MGEEKEGSRGRKGREGKTGKGGARGAFRQLKIYDYTHREQKLLLR